MGMLKEIAVKTKTVVAEDVSESIYKDLQEGNFDVVEVSQDVPVIYSDNMPDLFYGVTCEDVRETVILRLHSGYVLTIEEG